MVALLFVRSSDFLRFCQGSRSRYWLKRFYFSKVLWSGVFLVWCPCPIPCGDERGYFLAGCSLSVRNHKMRGDCYPVSLRICSKSFTSFSTYLVSAPAVSLLWYFIISILKTQGKTFKCYIFPSGTLPRGCNICCESLVTCICSSGVLPLSLIPLVSAGKLAF